jgi:DNA-directed RNA polymerase specialized sigma24 family protein
MPCDEAKPESPGEAGRPDRSLLRRLRGGEEDAATTLYLRYAERLQAVAKRQTSANLASRFDPEDVIQSVFRTFFRRASEGQYDVPEGEELWNLLLVISLNKIRALAVYHKAAKRDVTTTVAMAAVDPAQDIAGGGQDEALRVLQMVIDEMLVDFPAAQRDMIRLHVEGRPWRRLPRVRSGRNALWSACCNNFAIDWAACCPRKQEAMIRNSETAVAELEGYLDAFESAHAADLEPAVEDFVPDTAHPRYAEIVGELLRIDMELNWQRGGRALVDGYRRRFAVVLADPRRLAGLAFEEYRARCEAGEAATPADIGSLRHRQPTGRRRRREQRPPVESARSVAGLRHDQAATLSRTLLSGSAFRRWRKFLSSRSSEELGRGSFGRVCWASGGFNQPVAKLSARASVDRAALAVQHANIVPIYSFHRADGLYGVCMPFLGQFTLNVLWASCGGSQVRAIRHGIAGHRAGTAIRRWASATARTRCRSQLRSQRLQRAADDDRSFHSRSI